MHPVLIGGMSTKCMKTMRISAPAGLLLDVLLSRRPGAFRALASGGFGVGGGFGGAFGSALASASLLPKSFDHPMASRETRATRHACEAIWVLSRLYMDQPWKAPVIIIG